VFDRTAEEFCIPTILRKIPRNVNSKRYSDKERSGKNKFSIPLTFYFSLEHDLLAGLSAGCANMLETSHLLEAVRNLHAAVRGSRLAVVAPLIEQNLRIHDL